MKTMNYLFLLGLLILNASCTDYSPLGRGGSEETEGSFFESEFYQETLEYEARQLGRELVHLQEQMENENFEQEGRLEEIQNLLAVNEQNRDWNQAIIEASLDFRPRGPRPPRCEEAPDFIEFKPCPLPVRALDNLLLASEQWEKGIGEIEVFDGKGQLVGRMQGMTEVPNSDGTLLKAEIEFDASTAAEVRITNEDSRGEMRTSIYTIQ